MICSLLPFVPDLVHQKLLIVALCAKSFCSVSRGCRKAHFYTVCLFSAAGCFVRLKDRLFRMESGFWVHTKLISVMSRSHLTVFVLWDFVL